ncbi:MAG: phosphate signaling complex protein PhoU [Planctomycetes bacterium]|nr:phosphate signaling complex protein PhoU [Planctomycetota bacterium]
MTQHLRRDLEMLKREILDMGAMVEAAVNKAMSALVDRRVTLAVEVENADETIDAKEIAVEALCTRILALHQPVASDLRFVLATLKVNSDLERMGDLAKNIAERARYLGEHDPLALPPEFSELAERTRTMVRECLDAFVQQDPVLAERVLAQDDRIDELNRRMFALMEERMRKDGNTVGRGLQVLSCSRHLERIADMATNVCEEVVYLVRGEVIRHRNGAPRA